MNSSVVGVEDSSQSSSSVAQNFPVHRLQPGSEAPLQHNLLPRCIVFLENMVCAPSLGKPEGEESRHYTRDIPETPHVGGRMPTNKRF
jgi:hypothetical protein